MTEMKNFTERTIDRFLSMSEPSKRFVCMIDGKIKSGYASKHRSRAGVKYNRLLRLRRCINDTKSKARPSNGASIDILDRSGKGKGGKRFERV